MALLAVVTLGAGANTSQKALVPQTSAVDTPEAHLGKAYDSLKQDRYDEAASEFRAALKLDPTLTLRARFPLAVALFEMKKFDEARQEFEAVHREVGDHPNVLYYLGRVDLEERKFEGAIRNLNEAAAKPPFPDTAYFLGYAYFKQGDLAAAEKWLKEAAQANPRDARIPYQLGLVYRKQGREEEAKKALALSDELRQREDNESRLRMECAQRLDQGLRDEARAVCEQLYDPDDAEKLTELGTIYGQHGDSEAALKPLRRAAELAPQSPQMQYNLALAYFQLNRFEEARAPLANALQRWPDLFQLNALYGAVLSKLGEDLAAYQTLRHAHDDGIPIRFVISKKQRNCGPKSRNRIVAWLKYTGSPAVQRKQLPNKRRPTVSIRGSENSTESTSQSWRRKLLVQARQHLIGCNHFCA